MKGERKRMDAAPPTQLIKISDQALGSCARSITYKY